VFKYTTGDLRGGRQARSGNFGTC